MKIGGQSICDRGVKAIPAILEALVANRKDHKMLITTGGGTRSRHIYTIGLKMGMPTGVIPVMHGMPPYDYFAINPKVGRIPIHRTDVGL